MSSPPPVSAPMAYPHVTIPGVSIGGAPSVSAVTGGSGPSRLWVLQSSSGLNSPVTPAHAAAAAPTHTHTATTAGAHAAAMNGITTDFANIHIPKTPRTPKTPKGVSVPSRDSNLSEVGYPNWVSIFDGLLRKVMDEAQYGNYLGLDSTNDGSGESHGQAAYAILQATIGGHLAAFKQFLNQSLRAAPSTLPASPNPAAITAPIPPLSQQMLSTQIATFLANSTLAHQSQQLLTVMNGQVHFILGEIMRGAGFPVDTHLLPSTSGGSCGLRLMGSAFQARIYLLRSAMEARRADLQSRGIRAGQPVFYLSPSYAHSLGFPDTMPRYCWELGVTSASFKILALSPTADDRILADVGQAIGRLDPTMSDDGLLQSDPDMPNPFLTYQIDGVSLEEEIAHDIASFTGPTPPMPCAVFATCGNIAGLDLPYEYDNLVELSRIATQNGLSLHVEGTNLFGDLPKPVSSSASPSHSSTPATSALFDCVDSLTLAPGTWLGLSASAGTLICLKDPKYLAAQIRSARAGNGFWSYLQSQVEQHGPSMVTLGSTTTDEFERLFPLWFNLLQVNPQSFATLLGRLQAKQAEKIAALKKVVHAQSYPSFIAPAGELDEERTAYGQHLRSHGIHHYWLPPTPSHHHLFFYLSLPPPWHPNQFNMTVSQLNTYLSQRLSYRIASKQGEYAIWSRTYGLHLLPVVHFDRVGFMYSPAPVNIWLSDTAIEDEIAQFTKVVHDVIGDEVELIKRTGELRHEFQSLLESEADEWVYVPPECIETHARMPDGTIQSTGTIGIGGVRYLPRQVPEHHAAEIGGLLNEQLERLQSAMHINPNAGCVSSGGASPVPYQQMVSMYRGGLTKPSDSDSSSVCTVLDLSELVMRKGLKEILAELKHTASKLVYPAHITEDMNETLKQGIKLAEEKITTMSVDAYRPTNMLRWIPVVGSVLNWVAPVIPENGQQFDIKKKELSSIKYSYAPAAAQPGTPSLSRKGSSSSLVIGTNPPAALTPTSQVSTPSPLSSINQHTSTISPAALNTATRVPSPAQHARGFSTVAAGRPPLTPATQQQGHFNAPPVAINTHAPPTIQTSTQQPVQALSPQLKQQPVAQQPPHSQSQSQSTSPQSTIKSPPSQQQGQVTPMVSVSPRSIGPVRVSLDEADKSFVEFLNAAPRTLQVEQLNLLTRGETFFAYFPNLADDGSPIPASAGDTGAASTSVTKLHLFLEPHYMPSVDESLELGVPHGQPVSLLVWCEPGQRYVKTDQAVAVEQVSTLHLGTNEVFPRQTQRGNCFSLITQHVALHLEAESPAKRKAWFIALYTLVAQQPNINQTQTNQNTQQQQQQQQSQQQLLPYHPSTTSLPSSTVSSVDSESAARTLLESGMNFVVFVLDKHDIDLTTRHEVVLWMKMMPGTNTPQCLCWCRRGGALEYSPSRSLPLNKTVQVCLGKQTKAFKNAAALSADPAAAFSIMVEKMILNLEASSADDRANWLSSFHTVMSSVKRFVTPFDDEQQQTKTTNSNQSNAQTQSQ